MGLYNFFIKKWLNVAFASFKKVHLKHESMFETLIKRDEPVIKLFQIQIFMKFKYYFEFPKLHFNEILSQLEYNNLLS